MATIKAARGTKARITVEAGHYLHKPRGKTGEKSTKAPVEKLASIVRVAVARRELEGPTLKAYLKEVKENAGQMAAAYYSGLLKDMQKSFNDPMIVRRVAERRKPAQDEHITFTRSFSTGLTGANTPGEVDVTLPVTWKQLGYDYAYAKREWADIPEDNWIRKKGKNNRIYITRKYPVSTHFWKKTGHLANAFNQFMGREGAALEKTTRYTHLKTGQVLTAPSEKTQVIRGNMMYITYPKLPEPLETLIRKPFITGKVNRSDLTQFINFNQLGKPGGPTDLKRLAYAEFLRPVYMKYAAAVGARFRNDLKNRLHEGKLAPRFQQRKGK